MSDIDKPLPKKRGRKPKGGKIIKKPENKSQDNNIISNIILHLKCKTTDLDSSFTDEIKYNPTLQSVEGTTTNYYKPNELSYQILLNSNEIIETNNDSYKKNDKINNRELYNKLKNIQYSLHVNNITNKKSACFWCTYSFDNPVIYIPKSFHNDKYSVYGNFCSPECAAAFLFNEHIDSSTKFERYNLFNNIYANIYNYEKNIKPAPNPYYLLDKFMGSLTISEYRQLSTQEQLLFVMDKPMTRIFPELHDDNDEFLLNQHSISNKIDNNVSKRKKTPIFSN